jgi:uncharacterized protein (TIGR03086 family)
MRPSVNQVGPEGEPVTGTVDARLLSRVCVLADATLSDVSQDQLGLPTPCSEWVVQDLMEHIVSATDFFAEVADLGAASDDRDWPEYDAKELAPAFRRHSDRLVAAFERDGAMDRSMLLPSGPTSGSICIQVAVGELFVHSWDLQRSTGQPVGHNDIADVLLTSDWMALCDQVRASSTPPIGPSVAAGDGSASIERLVALLGRDPHFSNPKGRT